MAIRPFTHAHNLRIPRDDRSYSFQIGRTSEFLESINIEIINDRLTFWTKFAYEALRENKIDRIADQEWLHSHLEETRDGARGIVRVQC